MPIWINALGIGSIGVVYGYVLFYALKRYLSPASQERPTLRELFVALATLSAGGIIGASVTTMDAINYIGPYGIGLLLGSALNCALSFSIERHQYQQRLKHLEKIAKPAVSPAHRK